MRMKRFGKMVKTWGVVAGLAWMCLALTSCADEEAVDGVYFQVIDSEAILLGDLSDLGDVAMRLDLFQFGDEAGGVVRYYSLEEVRGSIDSPFDSTERVCFWTNRVTLDSDQVRFSLTFKDHRNQDVRLTLDRQEQGVILDGKRTLKRTTFNESVELPTPSMILERDPDLVARPSCIRTPVYINEREAEPFSATMLFDNALLELAEQEFSGQEQGQLRAGFLWVGSDTSEVSEWAAPLTNFNVNDLTITPEDRSISYKIYRGLPPGHLTIDSDTIPYINNEDFSFRMVLGVPVVYRDRQVEAWDENGDVSMDWDKNVEPLLGTSFRSIDGGRTYVGRVLAFVEGDEDASPGNYRQELFEGYAPRQGYEVVEVSFDAEERRITRITTAPAELDIFGITEGVYGELSMPRLPQPRRLVQ